MPTGAAQGGFPTGGSGATPSVTTDLVQSSAGNPLTLNGQTQLIAQVAGVTVLNLLPGSVTSAQPMVVPSIGETLTDQHSIPTGTADLVAADSPLFAASKTGSEVTLATLGASGGTWFVNQYVGPDSFVVGTSGTATNITPWPAPCPGLLKNFRVQGQSATTGTTTLTGYKSSGGNTLSYSSTAAVIVVANGNKSGSDTSNAVAVAAGDLWLFRSDTEWATGWGKITAQFIPTSA